MNDSLRAPGNSHTANATSATALGAIAAYTNVASVDANSYFPFSPETLLYYCSSRLDSIDKQIGAYFKDQQAKNRASKELSDVQAILGEASSQKGGNEAGFDPIIHRDAANRLLDIYRNAQTPEGKQAAAEAFKLRSGHDVSDFDDGHEVVADDIVKAKAKIDSKDASQWTQVIEGVKSKSAEVSKSAELNMIQLQSLVSQRQLAVQLTTQLMQAVHEGSKNVAGNIRA